MFTNTGACELICLGIISVSMLPSFKSRLCIPVKGFTKCWVAVSHPSVIPADTGSFYWYVCTYIYGLLAGDQNSDPDTAVDSAVILFSPTQLNSGVWPGSTWGCQLSIHWRMQGPLRGANHGCRMFFWFPLLSLYVFSSQITLLKWVCLSFVGPCDSVELAGCKTEPCYSSKKI